MAFISKLLAPRNTKNATAKTCKKNHNLTCHDLFTFSVEQVQVAVYHECDFRGRKLLFDSKSVERVASNCNKNANQKHKSSSDKEQSYIEITNGCGYFLKKPSSDINNLAEMIFGAIAMTYRGTLYKIHNLDLPPRLVLSQVFPSPRGRHSHHHQTSAPSKILDYTLLLDDSAGSGSSQTSNSDQSNSDHLSTASDPLLICRRQHNYVPLDVPLYSSLISSSGYGGELSTSSLSSGPPSVVPEDYYKLSHSFSDNSTHRSLPTSMTLGDEHRGLRHKRTSKLGLAIILQMPVEQERGLDNFIMQHISLIESYLKRVRQEVEIAYIHHHTFVSAMFELALNVGQWFVTLFTTIGSNVNMWHQLCNCDIPISIKSQHLLEDSGFNKYSDARSFRSLTRRLFKREKPTTSHVLSSAENDQLEIFVRDLCELVELFDVKQTNFFLSTLMTGVLTYHLGWVTALLPREEIRCKRSSNLFVRQLCDLYGCIGYPGKLAHTIITGEDAEELIKKFINVLTYFIRCGEVSKTYFERQNINVEHDNVDKMCNDASSLLDTARNIPKLERTYNIVRNNEEQSFQSSNINSLKLTNIALSVQSSGIRKVRSCLRDLSKLEESQEIEPCSAISQDHEDQSKVLFVVGADERLENLPTKEKKTFEDVDFTPTTCEDIKLSMSCTNLVREGVKHKRAQSEEPARSASSTQKTTTAKYRYSGVKFNFQQYPQIFENYMKSKNIELSEIHLQSKEDFFCNREQKAHFDFSKYGDTDDSEDDEPLQTPSNATELEYTSDLVLPTSCKANVMEVVEIARKSSEFVRRSLCDTKVIPETQVKPLKTIELPMPSYETKIPTTPLEFVTTLIRSCSPKYMPNIALQGFINPPKDWQATLKRDLILSAKQPICGEAVEESLAIVGNVDSWTVNVISSHTFVIDKTAGGVPIGMSQLVANMLESLLNMWKLHTPPEYCLMHIEQKLREFCVQSKALAQMLLDTEYCTIDLLTSTLKLEVSDVPLLMAVASVHTPEVTEKYGLRFQ